MRIGIDFDNTIVSYDVLFHKVALEAGYIPAELTPSKVSVRDYLRRIGKENIWTEMQGHVYGVRMAEAQAFPGVLEFLCWAHSQAIEIAIISHKTRHPVIGPKHDLHKAAREWVENVLRDGDSYLVEPDKVFLEITKENKLRRKQDLR